MYLPRTFQNENFHGTVLTLTIFFFDCHTHVVDEDDNGKFMIYKPFLLLEVY